MTKACCACGAPRCGALADFGVQPVCHHFFDGGRPEATYPLVLGQCGSCGLVQLLEAVPPEKLVPRYDWVTYTEPERHLDALVDVLRRLPGISPESLIAGLSFKEDTTLERFRRLGFRRTARVDTQADLGGVAPRAGIETIYNRLGPREVDELRRKRGAPGIILVRHGIEHTHRPMEFLATLRRWVDPQGYVVFELPDCERGLDFLDYTTLWEDHSLYFTRPTLLATLARGGFSVHRFECYESPYEKSLVAITRPTSAAAADLTPAEARAETERGRRFGEGFPARRAAVRNLLEDWRKRGKVALFGAGHHAAVYTNVLGLGDLIDFVIDDDPHKRGLRMPGSRLPILGSEALLREGVRLCLSSLSAESEQKVLSKHRAFVEAGGAFASIFPVRSDAPLHVLTEPQGAR